MAESATKVFVGNLSFRVQQDELQKFFEQAGKVLSANVITRGNRSRGYGFVEMATLEDAQRAVEQLNSKEIDSRAINVEIAKPREEGAAPARGRGGGRRGRGGYRGGRFRRGGRGGRGGRGRSEEGGEAPASPSSAPASSPAPAAAPDAGSPASAEESDEKDKKPRRGGRGRGQRRTTQRKGERVASKDTLFVANLPFATTDNELKEFFQQQKPTQAHVVVGRAGRSKGFGFVTFGDDESQQSALGLNGKELQGRALSIKVAWNPDSQEKQEATQA